MLVFITCDGLHITASSCSTSDLLSVHFSTFAMVIRKNVREMQRQVGGMQGAVL